MRLWLCRDEGKLGQYVLYSTARVSKDPCGEWESKVRSSELCALFGNEFHRATGFRLKPGEGPVEVKITVERVNK